MLKKNETMGMLWLKANDPQYVSPAKKAAKTRKTDFDYKAYEQTISEYTTTKINGKWVNVPVGVGFCCGGEGRVEPSYAATQEDELLAKEIKACSKTHRGGAKTKSEKNKIRRDKKKAEKKAKYKK